VSKYQRWHDHIIGRARHRILDPYKERHHIQPRALGGSDDPDNLVDLTYREHFLVHWLLIKLLTGYERRLMLYALNCMAMDHLSGRLVASWRIDLAMRILKREALQRAELRKALRLQALKDRAADALRVHDESKQITDSRKHREVLNGMAKRIIRGDPRDIAHGRKRKVKRRRYRKSFRSDPLDQLKTMLGKQHQE
jgi:hypothetical protein